MNPRKLLLARSWPLSLTSTTLLVCVGVLAAWAQTEPPTPLPTPTQINFKDPLGSVKFTETMWQSVGSRYPLKPRTWPDAGAFTRGARWTALGAKIPFVFPTRLCKGPCACFL